VCGDLSIPKFDGNKLRIPHMQMQGTQDAFSVDLKFNPSNMCFTPDPSSIKLVKLPWSANRLLITDPCANGTLRSVWRGAYHGLRNVMEFTYSVSAAGADGALKQYKIDNGCK
jgi:hypothetical protein